MDIFGRKDKLFELQKAWAVALSGRPRIVFVEGADGVGKSHLVGSFLDMIRDQQTTEQRPLIGTGRCADVGGWTEPLRPAWDGLCGLLDSLDGQAGQLDYACLPQLAQLSAVVPDVHLPDAGPRLARLLADDAGSLRIPRAKYLHSPEILIRDSLLTLSGRQPVALFIDEFEHADAATLTLLANLVDVLWEQDQPFYFLLVLAYQPELAESRGMLQRLEDHLRRHDRPDNRIISRVRLEGVGRSATATVAGRAVGGLRLGDDGLDDWLTDYTGGNPRAAGDLLRGLHARGLVENRDERLVCVEPIEQTDDGWRLPVQFDHWLERLGGEPRQQAARAMTQWLDRPARSVLAAASLQGRRFSPATVSTACGIDELEVVRILNELANQGVVRRTSGPAAFDLFGHGVFEFESPLYVDALRATMSPEERELVHGRIANHLLLQRSRLRDGRKRLVGSAPAHPPQEPAEADVTDKFARDADKLDRALRTLDLLLVRHLSAAGRAIETSRFLAEALDNLAAAGRPNEFVLAERARHTVAMSALAERALLELVALQPKSEPSETMRASFDVAMVAADLRMHMGCYDTALGLLDHALSAARWLAERDLVLRALGRKLEALYRCAQHRRARELFEQAVADFQTTAPPGPIIELFRTFQRWEHPDVSVDRLEALAESVGALGRGEIADAAYELVLEAHAEMLFERWDIGELGQADLADIAREAQEQGFAAAWLAILLDKFEARVREERVLHAWFHLQSREPLGLVRAAIEVLERSKRMAEILKLTVDSARAADDEATADRARIGYAEVFGLWRDRARTIIEAWDAGDGRGLDVGDDKPIANLRRAALTGRLGPKAYVAALRNGVEAADRQQALRAALALRSRLSGQPAMNAEDTEQVSTQMQRLAAHADNESLSLYLVGAQMRDAEMANDEQRLAELSETAEASAAKFYARADEGDRIWLADIAAQMAGLGGRELDRDAWFKHQVQTLGRAPSDKSVDHLPALDLVEAAREAAQSPPAKPSVRGLLAQADGARSKGELDEALDALERARRRVPDAPECWAAARDIDEALVRVFQARGDDAEALGALRRSIERSRSLGQWDVAVESLGRATQLARTTAAASFWELHGELMQRAVELGSIDQLDRAFDICFDLLERAQRQPVFEEAEPLRLEDALEDFVGENAPTLRELGADTLLSKWDAMLARVIEQTKQMNA